MSAQALSNPLLFPAFDEATSYALQSVMTRVELARGEHVFSEGEPGDRLYAVLTGKVKLSHASGDGRENVFSIVGPGEMFGELSVLDPGPRISTAVAVTDVTLLTLSANELYAWLLARPEGARQMLAALARRLRRTSEALGDLVFTDVPGRLAKAILELSERFGQVTEDGLRVQHDLTQEELAQLVGASRETVNKALADFSSRGWLIIQSRALILTDVERLRKRAR